MKHPTQTASLLAKHRIVSDQISQPSLGVVLSQLEAVLQIEVPGDIVELGCYLGSTTLFLRRLLDAYNQSSKRRLWAYDSFSGLPDKSLADASGAGEQFKGGELAVTKKQFLLEFHKANLKPPVTHKAWFKELTPSQLPNEIAFGFLDGDFYESIIDSLQLVWPRLALGGIITIDDYQRAALPGVERAVEEFFANKPIHIHHEHQIAIITKK